MSTKVFRSIVKLLVMVFFLYGLYRYFQNSAGLEGRNEALILGVQVSLVIGVVVGGLWLLDRYVNRKGER